MVTLKTNKKVLKRNILLVFLLLFITNIVSQQPVSVHLTEKDGLPDNEFYDILEDDYYDS